MQEVIKELKKIDPNLYKLIHDNPEMMLQLLLAGTRGGRKKSKKQIHITPEEKASIDRV
jgi:hypothetical protein